MSQYTERRTPLGPPEPRADILPDGACDTMSWTGVPPNDEITGGEGHPLVRTRARSILPGLSSLCGIESRRKSGKEGRKGEDQWIAVVECILVVCSRL